ncbi:hypothetical protein BaRGS_00014839 [Batillaria attramentaria]|uniref:Uncharacterized protein n=1 Tax=Batillaria attramentaria TaxID=370345 RepID=A0ABD0L3P8_9CAEN
MEKAAPECQLQLQVCVSAGTSSVCGPFTCIWLHVFVEFESEGESFNTIIGLFQRRLADLLQPTVGLAHYRQTLTLHFVSTLGFGEVKRGGMGHGEDVINEYFQSDKYRPIKCPVNLSDLSLWC